MKCLNLFKKNCVLIITLVVIISAQCFFVCQKEGYHMDELLSFELSNAAYNPWIVPTQPVGRLAKFFNEEIYADNIVDTAANAIYIIKDTLTNRGGSILANYKADVYEEPIFISAEEFHRYITVDLKDCFRLTSVYFNVKDDNHPPVHFMLLHIMSSIFQNSLNPFIGCSINIVAIAIVIIMANRLFLLLERENYINQKTANYFTVIFAMIYALSHGGIASVLLIRMYALVSMFGFLYFYLITKKYLSYSFDKDNVGLCIITVLGFLSQYFFLFIVIPMAFIMGIILITEKRYKEFRKFIHTMGLSGCIGVAVYPFCIGDVLYSGRGVEAVGNIFSGFGGYGRRLLEFAKLIYINKVGFYTFLLCGIVFIICGVLSLYRGNSKIRKILVLLYATVVVYVLVVAKAAPMFEDRYLMPVFPIASVAMTITIAASLRNKKEGSQIAMVAGAVVAVLMLLWGSVLYDGEYLYKGYNLQLDIAKQYKEYPCICVRNGDGFYYNLLEFEQYEKTLIVTNDELMTRKNTEDIVVNDKIVLLIKGNADDDKALEAMYSYGYYIEKPLMIDSPYGDDIYLLKK